MNAEMETWTRWDALATTDDVSTLGSSAPRDDPRRWTEWTDLAGADPTQARVYVGGGTEAAVEAVPGCNCCNFSRVLLELLANSPLGWDWLLDLAALPRCDRRFLVVLLKIAADLGRCGGRLVVVGLDRVSMRPIVRDRFVELCRKQVHTVEGRWARADRPVVVN